ncbi:MAG: Flagellar biosynthesis/type III secretory pathway protein FliH [Candidatus Midichloria mitochondrii]|uniref:Flagellar assembly protein FliH n=2 Tax=Candidatus Midichloria mitochondrii TaxID=234827 RepID=F7XVL8_MIDMI|nr:flagellar assembly protein FliH [Candidatus Midichloria mitochondrii]AEI88717.1 flagellar assembly protein fliH [Candidatus Midichloria mitochondrii IricVA]MDJ1256172.1 flagellar assembly protein FliH [Candidatus Midichloria mitochondrii]MDJ1287891.1 flagellar assembly protein FliH [Candidatus Midichloria mitochondrii]MDJ1298715.1 flagellar assembly protein FliH [Candidatus Midichloria mitochondrii]MDJ1312934.1 flagellar assembly protein FliH [Candidatus Midichloria mitochondrii]
MKIEQYPILDLSKLELVETEAIPKSQKAEIEITETKEETATLDVAVIKREAFLSGKNEAMKEVESQKAIYDQNLLSIINSLKEKFNGLSSELQNRQELLINDSIELCMTIAKKIIEKSVENTGLDLIKSFLADQLPKLYSENLITIKVAPEYVEDIRQYIEEVIHRKNHTMEVDIVFDEAISPGDCAIEVDGSKISRDWSKLLIQLDRLLSNYYAKNLDSEGYITHSISNN